MGTNRLLNLSKPFGVSKTSTSFVIRSSTGNTGRIYTTVVGLVMFAVALVFVWRSVYAMRIPKEAPVSP